MKKFLSLLLVLALVLSLGLSAYASGEPSAEPSAEAASLELTDPAWEKSADGSYYSLKNVVYCTNVVNASYQYMNIYVPAAYIDGGECNGYTAETAPIIFENNCMGWNSSTPGNANSSYLAEGFVHVSCGARSRNAENGTGKMPAPVVDQKAGVRMLRLNADVIPGDEEKIVSLGSSGGGQMSSILGATGNMDEYYADLVEIGAAGIELVNGEYVSTINDNIYASMCYCPIVDLDNADLAYAWIRFDAGETGASTMFGGDIVFSDFQLALQDDLAVAFAEYINALGIVNEEGEVLSFNTGASGEIDPRSGSYYDQILENMSDALNAWIAGAGYTQNASGEMYDTFDAYYASLENAESWLVKNADGTYSVTDMAGFLNGTGLARNKDIPGFDTFYATEEGNGFGTAGEAGMHFSASVAAVLEENYAEYSAMPGFGDQDVDVYIEQAAREDIQEQAYLMNATHIMLDVANGEQEADISKHWRTRNGTKDEHTSFTIAYNLAMAANMAGAESVDYSLVWNMGHGSDEGTTTGTFVDWVHEICAETVAAETGIGVDEAYLDYIYEFLLAELQVNGNMTMEQIETEYMPLIAARDYTTVPAELLWNGMLVNGVALTFEEFAAQYDAAGTASAGDTSKAAYAAYLKEYVDACPAVADDHLPDFYALIDAEDYTTMPADMMFNAEWWGYAAMTYDEFVAAGGIYEIPAFDPSLTAD